MTRLAHAVTAASLVALVAIMSTGCSFPAPGEELYRTVYKGHVTGMTDDTDKILGLGCKFVSGTVNPSLDIRGRCDIALSNGISDLANDIHTGLDIARFIPDVSSTDIKNNILNNITNRCTTAVNSGLAEFVDTQTDPGIASFVQNYISTNVNVHGICAGSVNTLWDETNDNTYSGGHRCAAMHLNLRFTSVNTGPSVSRSAYTIDESASTYPGCPLERVQITPCQNICIPFGGPCTEVCQTLVYWGHN